MKKLLTLMLCIVLSFSFTGCGEEDTTWINDVAAKMSKEITSGEVYVDDDILKFPMELQDIIDQGWHITNNITNEKTFKLGVGEMTDEFLLFPDDNHEDCISVSVVNLTTGSTTVDKCSVASLSVEASEFDFVLPNGITKRSTEEDIEKAYGKAVEVAKDGSYKVYKYTYKTEAGFACVVSLKTLNGTYPLSEVAFSIDFNNSFVEEQSTSEMTTSSEKDTTTDKNTTVEKDTTTEEPTSSNVSNAVYNNWKDYFDACMKVCYYNNYVSYVTQGLDTIDNAKALYQSYVEYYAKAIMEYSDVTTELVTDEIFEEYCNIAKTVLKKFKWEFSNITLLADDKYSLELVLYPTNYFDLIDSQVDAAIEEYETKYASVDFDNITDEEYAEIEIDYANMVLKAIKGSENKVELTTGIKKVYEVTSQGLSDEQWDEIDNIIMGFAE